jgi:hypothetical protein
MLMQARGVSGSWRCAHADAGQRCVWQLALRPCWLDAGQREVLLVLTVTSLLRSPSMEQL